MALPTLFKPLFENPKTDSKEFTSSPLISSILEPLIYEPLIYQPESVQSVSGKPAVGLKLGGHYTKKIQRKQKIWFI